MDRLDYVWLAYSVSWLAIFGYTLLLGQRQRKLSHEIALLRDAIAGKKGK